MTFRDYLIVMSIATAAAWTGWGVVLGSIDPIRAGAPGFLFFYASLASALIGTLSILGAAVRVFFKRDIVVSRHVGRAFRQAILLSVLVIACLVLLSSGYFRWWTVGTLILAVACIELAVVSSQHNRQ